MTYDVFLKYSRRSTERGGEAITILRTANIYDNGQYG